MPKQQYSVKFFLNKGKLSLDNEMPIYVRIIMGRKKVEFSTRFNVKNVNDWEPQLQRLKGKNSLINKELSQIYSQIESNAETLSTTKKHFTAKDIKDTYFKTNDKEVKLLEFLQEYINHEITEKKGFAEGTLKNYTATYNHVFKFLTKNKFEKIFLSNITEDVIEQFDNFLASSLNQSQSALKRNTCNKYHTKLKSMLSYAVSKKLLSTNPYNTIKFRHEESAITFLSKDELERISNHSLGGNQSLLKVRDIFFFSVYSALRWGSAMELRRENLEFDGKQYWIQFKQKGSRQKIGHRFLRLPLLDKALEVINKYKSECEITGYLLPRISNQKFNTYLKVIAEFCEIKKPLTHHVARHTAATNFLSKKIPLERVSALLGHSDIKSTQHYAKVTNEMLAETAEELNKKFK